MTFERILVPVDGSEHALTALDYGVALQEKFGSELMLLCVYRHYSLLEASMSMVRPEPPENLDKSMQEYATGVVEDAKKHAAELGSKNLRGFVKSGAPARTIVNFAKDRNISLIVLGSRGMGDVEGYLLGSVSHKVTSLAHCPVMVV
ncbi:MAG TPA: universal stress protein [Gammaproteobacteria bacterium]|nr:universal stress protein [Gammaproteobacteria bacterium]